MSAPLFADPTVLAEPGPFADPTVLVAPSPLEPVAPHDHHLRLALELAAAFLVCAQLARNYLGDQSPKNVPHRIAAAAWKSVMPVWLSLAGGAIRRSMVESGAAPEVDTAMLAKFALDYAGGIGDYLGQSSVEAFSQGVESQLADRWGDMAAFTRASVGFGLDRSAMAAFLKVASAGAVELVSPAARAQADNALVTRAQLIGDTEAATSHETIRLLMWQHMAAIGQLPAGTQREWHTAVREDTCPICGPLNHVRVALDEPFLINNTEIWAPQAHPNCRCRVELTVEVAKAYNVRNPKGSKHGGQFTKKPEPIRAAKPVKEQVRTVDPVVEAMIAEAARTPTAEPDEEVEPVEDEAVEDAPDAFAAPPVDAFAIDPFTSDAFAVDPFAAEAEEAFATPPADAFAGADPFAGADLFANPSVAHTGEVFRPEIPVLTIRGTDIHFMPVPQRGTGRAYYMPSSTFLGQYTMSGASKTLVGLGAKLDFGPYRNQPPDQAPFVAAAADSPWAALRDADLAHQRLTGHWRLVNEESRFIPNLTDDEVRSAWDIMRPDLERGWGMAVDDASEYDHSPLVLERRGIVDRLSNQDLVTIAQMANLTNQRSLPDVALAIRRACDDVIGAHEGLKAAYADYVVFHRPDLLGSLGDSIATQLGVASSSGMNLTRPVDQVLKFRGGRPGFHPGTKVNERTAEPTKQYRATSIQYHSAIEDQIYRPFAMGLQVVTMEPFVQR